MRILIQCKIDALQHRRPKMRYGSVCSGIEAATLAWHGMGWKAAWLSEIEPFPCSLLAHHYPTVPNLGDMTTIPARIRAGNVEAPDVLVGGTPCQAFSLAGLRGGLSDSRGQLTLTFVETANEIDSTRIAAGKHECVIVWENVPGVLSSKDNAFGNFLAGLAGESEPLRVPRGKWPNAGHVSGPQRTVVWRVLDAQYFGVAQRRRRVFVVASARKDIDVGRILFEFEGMRRDFAPGGEHELKASGGVVACLDASYGKLQGCSGQDARHGHSHLVPVAFNHQAGGSLFPISPRLDLVNTLQAHQGQAVKDGMGVRRLTPVEFERLQGFPDGYTLVPYRKKPAADGPRYKAIGNSMAVPVMRWIGQRIQVALFAANDNNP